VTEHERIAQKLDTLYARVLKIDSDNTFVVAQLANYACILSASYLERAMVDVASEYCEKRAVPAVSTFVNAQLGRFPNPRAERVRNFVSSFGEPIRTQFASIFTDEIQTAIDSVVSNRNNLAHGRNATVTFSMLKAWDNQLRKFVHALKENVFV
jgi:hypothetical protein